jgi:hypothetical protein
MSSVETVVSRRKGSRRIHYVRYNWPPQSMERYHAVCGQSPPPNGWLVIPLGLDDPKYGRSHILCDRCFDTYVGPQH